MTVGAISKTTRKLIKKGVLESYRKSDNKKEIYFRLTEQGKAVFKIHDDLHREFQERDKAVFEQVTDEQFDIMLDFTENYGSHLDAEIKKRRADIKSE
jgi:DNA-binding MarR family transcriptional regulator